MELKALVTRQIAIADESIRIQIEDCDNFEDFKDKVLEACLIGDSRVSVQMQRLAHDTDLTKNFTQEEKEAFLKAAYILHPEYSLPEEPKLKDGCRFEFSKINASGESIVLQLMKLDSYDELVNTVYSLWHMLDQRLYTTNERQVDHLAYLRTLPMEQQIAIGIALDVLYGRAFKETAEQRLASRELERQEAK